MQVWIQDESYFIDVFNDYLITKNLSEEIYEKFGSHLIYDLRDLNSMQLIESIDFLKNRKMSHVLIAYSVDFLKIANSVFKSQITHPTIDRMYFSVEYKGDDVIECARISNVDCVMNVVTGMSGENLRILKKIIENKKIITTQIKALEFADGVII